MNYINIPGSENEYFVLFHGTDGNEYSLLSVVGDINPNTSVISFLGDTLTDDFCSSRRGQSFA